MDPVSIGLSAGGAAVSLIARLIGEAIAAGDMKRAEDLKAQAVAEYGDGILPQLEAVQAQEVGATELGKIKTDGVGRGAQVSALERLGQFADNSFSAEDAAEQRRVVDQSAGVAARQAAQGEQLAAARGLQRSGLSQALNMQAAQGGAQSAADATAQLAAQRRQRQLQALGMLGSQGGALRGADYGEASDAASAQDAINRFNANMRQGAVDQRNRNAMSQYGAQMQLKGARNNARGDLANYYTGRGEQNRQTAQDIGAGVQQGMQGGADYMERTDLNKRRYPGGK